MNYLELLAPAKNLLIGTAAIDCGADAVYIAGPEFGARERAGNSFEDISSLCSYAHRFGSKVYITINTLLKKDEFARAGEYIWKGYEIGCDGVIIQDLRILSLNLPPIKLIASTQCNTREVERAVFLENRGFERVILARELSLEQIKEIRKATNCELEFFVHGALCVCYSGCCFLSEYLTGRSANRGECAQPCRNNYDLITEDGKEIVKKSPLLSLKDLNFSHRIGDLVKAGISSFKIEGRLKNISYVKNIVTLYNRAINDFISLYPNEYCRASLGVSFPKFQPTPLSTFNRGYTEYFLNGEKCEQRRKNLNSGIAKYIGEPIGKIVSCSLINSKHREFKINYSPLNGTNSLNRTNSLSKRILNNGDGICFALKNGEVVGGRVNSTHENEANIQIADYKGNNLSLTGLTIYRNLDFAFEKVLENKVKRLIPIELKVSFENGITIEANGKKYSFEYESFPSEDKDRCTQIVVNQLSKESGNYIFKVIEIAKGAPFYRASTLNKIRRELGELLATENIEPQNKKTHAALVQNNIATGWKPFEGYDGELMRTKYCIRYELGMCLKENKFKNGEKSGDFNQRLYLRNNGKLLKLKFDCKNCEMVVAAENKIK